MNKLDFKHVCTLFLLFSLVGVVLGDTEFCIKSNYEPMYWLNASQCPFGILFPDPVLLDCFATTETSEVMADVCESKLVEPGTATIQFQYISEFNGPPIEKANSCNVVTKCGNRGRQGLNWTAKVKPFKLPEKEMPWPEIESATPPYTPDARVYNQTERMFKHLMGFVDADEGPSTLRIVTLLKKSFEILGKFCDNRFVPMEFGQDVEQAFNFILAESIHHKIVDVPIEDFRRIDKALNHCLDQRKPFRFIGSGCRRFATIEAINFTKTGDLIGYDRDEFSWSAEKYDIPVDVTWSAMDFVHGLCYGTFREHVNSHHLYQQAIERLFLPEILYRWDKPIRLARQHVWDHFFSANVRGTIRNLEHCVQAAYFDAPFLHRLERMLLKFSGANATDAAPSRKKRSPVPLPKYDKLKFHCFSTDTQRDSTIEKYKASACTSPPPETP